MKFLFETFEFVRIFSQTECDRIKMKQNIKMIAIWSDWEIGFGNSYKMFSRKLILLNFVDLINNFDKIPFIGEGKEQQEVQAVLR